MKRLAIIGFTLLLSGSSPAAAGRPTQRQTWQISLFSWINRTPAEKGAPPNSHPLLVKPAALEQALGTLYFVEKSQERPLFGKEELPSLAAALAEALSMAEPGEDLELVSTAKHDEGWMGLALSVTARIFAQDGKLNVLVHDVRLDWAYAYTLTRQMPSFEYGSRGKPSSVVLLGAGVEERRPDWVVLTLEPATRVGSVPQVPPKPAGATPSLEDRLRSLKRLREQDLINEEDYTKRKQEILKEI